MNTRPPACRVCGETWGVRPSVYHYGRGLCSSCYMRAARRGTLERWPTITKRGKTAAIVEDVAFFAMTGEAASQWPERVGMTPAALRSLLRRHGRKDLAREVSQAFPRA